MKVLKWHLQRKTSTISGSAFKINPFMRGIVGFILMSLIVFTVYLSYYISHSYRSQLEMIVSDRPEMLAFFKRNDSVWNWINNRFLSASGSLVLWDNSNTIKNSSELAPICQFYPSIEGSSRIQVSQFYRGSSLNGEIQLSSLIFELCNCCYSKQFISIDKDAIDKTISKRDYVNSKARLEYQSELDLHQFYVNVWIPHVQQEHLLLHPNIWDSNYFPSFELFLQAHLERHDGYPAYYEHYYDLLQSSDKPLH